MYLICGEALFDLFGTDTSDISIGFDARIGGSPFNVAMGLARLGEEAAFFGGISRDAFGKKLMRKLEDEGVFVQHIARSDHLTTLSVVQKDASGVPAYTFYGANAADRMVTEADLPTLERAPLFLHVGSYSALVDPVASALKALIKRERARTLISFDPNIRPTVVPDMDQWRANTESLATLSDVIKVSDEDLALIAPNAPVEAIARAWLAKGARLVIVTRGDNGASAFNANAEITAPGVKINVEDTVGAGDTFQAALLAGLKTLGATDRTALDRLDGHQLTSLLEFCVQAAAVTCARRGADLPRKAELEKEWSALRWGADNSIKSI